MNGERFGAKNLAYDLYCEQKKMLDLIKERGPGSGFDLAICRLFGDNPKRGKSAKIGSREFMYAKPGKNLVSFLPLGWQEELDKTKEIWSGCENWWAGYPFIIWVEIIVGDDGIAGYLRLTAEIGPISNHRARKAIIEAIKRAASANGLERIQFPAGATDKGRLYSRFLRNNTVALNDIRNVDEVERQCVKLITDFGPEFDLVGGVVPQFQSFSV